MNTRDVLTQPNVSDMTSCVHQEIKSILTLPEKKNQLLGFLQLIELATSFHFNESNENSSIMVIFKK